LFLSFFKILSFITFLDVIFAKGNVANPFSFMQANCSYSLATIPVIDDNVRQTWLAFDSIVNHLINGTAGAITQLNQTISAPNIWLERICHVDFALRGNCSNETVASFLNDFKSMLNNDTAVVTARKCQGTDLPEKILFGIIVGIVALSCLVCIVSFIRSCCTTYRRREYDDLGDGEGNDNVVYDSDGEPQYNP
jgi:hypothetical protein